MLRTSHKFLILLALPLLFVAVACSDDNNSSNGNGTGASSTGGDVTQAAGGAREAKSELCGKLEDLGNALDKAESLNSSSSVEDAKQAGQEVKDSANSVKEAAGNTASAAVTLIQTAGEALSSALNNVSGSQTLGAAAAAIQAPVKAITNAQDDLERQSGCPTPTP
jgi:hypothetical protein